jgi:hypothetical protein
MLSKVEVEFLNSPEKFNAAYARVLRCRIKAKTTQQNEELELLRKCCVTENCNGVTEFSNGSKNFQSLNQSDFGDLWSLRRDLDPRPLPYQVEPILTSLSLIDGLEQNILLAIEIWFCAMSKSTVAY